MLLTGRCGSHPNPSHEPLTLSLSLPKPNLTSNPNPYLRTGKAAGLWTLQRRGSFAMRSSLTPEAALPGMAHARASRALTSPDDEGRDSSQADGVSRSADGVSTPARTSPVPVRDLPVRDLVPSSGRVLQLDSVRVAGALVQLGSVEPG